MDEESRFLFLIPLAGPPAVCQLSLPLPLFFFLLVKFSIRLAQNNKEISYLCPQSTSIFSSLSLYSLGWQLTAVAVAVVVAAVAATTRENQQETSAKTEGKAIKHIAPSRVTLPLGLSREPLIDGLPLMLINDDDYDELLLPPHLRQFRAEVRVASNSLFKAIAVREQSKQISAHDS